MRIPLEQLDRVVSANKGKPGKPGDKPDNNIHIARSDKEEQPGDGKGRSAKDKIEKINSHDEMVDGDKDHDVLEGSDKQNDRKTPLKDTKEISKEAVREIERQQANAQGTSAKSPLPTSLDLDRRNYKDVLKELFSLSTKTGPRSHTNPIRRYAASSYTPPGRVVKKQLNNFILALDTSGSITPGMIAKFLGTAQRISEQFKHNNLYIKIILYTDNVYREKDFTPTEAKGMELSNWLKKNIDTTGGNYFSNVAEYISKIKGIEKYKGAIFLTDGEEAWKPFKLPPLKHIFLIDGNPHSSGLAADFLSYVKKQRPAGKEVDIYQINSNL
jgi:predicted metal-dependent peptidase